jgi:hypothetical protein
LTLAPWAEIAGVKPWGRRAGSAAAAPVDGGAPNTSFYAVLPLDATNFLAATSLPPPPFPNSLTPPPHTHTPLLHTSERRLLRVTQRAVDRAMIHIRTLTAATEPCPGKLHFLLSGGSSGPVTTAH